MRFRCLPILAVICLIISSNLFAVKNGNCWDPRTWTESGHAHAGLVVLDEMPMEFLNDSSFLENFSLLLSSTTHVESQTVTLEKLVSNDSTKYIVTARKSFMPPTPRVVSHFTVDVRREADVANRMSVGEVVQGCFSCSE